MRRTASQGFSCAVSLSLLLACCGDLYGATTLVGATLLGPVKSTDGGATWSVIPVNVNGGLLSGQPNFYTLAIDPKTPSTWYANGVANGTYGFYKTADSGQTWTGTAFGSLKPRTSDSSIAIDPVATNILYLIAHSTNAEVVKSIDSGATWSPLKLPNTSPNTVSSFPNGASPQFITTDPKISGVVYAVDGGFILKSVDFGVTWIILSSGVDSNIVGTYPDVERLDVDPNNSQILYASAYSASSSSSSLCKGTAAGGACGLYKSIDGGKSWTELGLPSPGADSLSIDPVSGAIYVGAVPAASSPTVFKSTDGGITFTPLKNGIGGIGGPYARVDPNNTSTVYAFNHIAGTGPVYYRSNDSGVSWTSVKIPNLCPVGSPTNCSASTAPYFYDLKLIPSANSGSGFVCTNTTAPLITSIDSASAYGGYPYFASGSWLEIKGTNLADPADPRLTAAINPGQWTAADFTGSSAPTLLDGVSVSINGKPAYIWYLSTGQLNVQAPEDTAAGNVAITVTNCKASSSLLMFARRALAPGFLSPSNYAANGTQYLVATFASDGAYVLNTSTGASFGLNSRPAKPGDVIVAYGIGFGDVTPSILPGVIVGQSNALVSPIAVSFGSTPAALSYSGLAGSFVGLYEFYITVPSLANGDYQINVTQAGIAVPQTMYLTVHN